MRAQVLGQVVDPRGEQRDLYLGLTGVGWAVAELFNQLLLAFLGEGHARGEASRAPSLAQLARSLNVHAHLLHERVDRLEPALAAQTPEEIDLQLVTV